MKYIKKENTLEFKNGDLTTIEYPFNDKDINCAIVTLKGRHPKEDWILNQECKELVYIIKGSTTLTTETETVNLNEGDMVILEPNEKYFWQGDCVLLTPTTPAWTPEQTKIVK
jgi:mannose-6-phosphate isomerase-like protein (cupin superfamily)